MSSLDPLTQIAAQLWLKNLKKAPALTSLISAFLAITIASVTLFLSAYEKDSREKRRLSDLNYKTQVGQLEETEKNVKQLLHFIELQKSNIQKTQDTIESLKQEQEELRPLVEGDREIINALFKAYEERSLVNAWTERWIGFGFGLIASLIASFLWYIIKLSLLKKQDTAG